jgi:hypothetical protein
MIGQDAIRQDADGMPLVRLDYHAIEGVELSFFVEHMHPNHRPVQDVINKPTGCGSRRSWHGRRQYQLLASLAAPPPLARGCFAT